MYKRFQKKVNILGFDIDNLTKEEAIEEVERFSASEKFNLIVTANPLILLRGLRDPEYARVLHNASLILADGVGLIWASKLLRRPLKQRIPGISLLLSILYFANELGKTVYFLGGRRDVNKKLNENILRNFTNLRIVGTYPGFFPREREKDIMLAIRKAQPDFLFVGMGAPKQEKWIFYNQDTLNSRTTMGVGGSFDVISGKTSRSPEWMQNLGLEWLYRIMINPFKFFRIFSIMKFIILVYIQRIKEILEERKKRTKTF